MLRKNMIHVTVIDTLGRVVQVAKFQRITSAEDFAADIVARNPFYTVRID